MNSPLALSRSRLPGQLYGIGVGPGDPDLITLKALKVLQQTSIVAFPAGRDNKPGLAQQIIAPWLQPHQQQLPLYFPYVQDQQQLHRAWHRAAQQVAHFLVQGQDVVFASEGDVSFYSTFSYLAHSIQQLQPNVVVQTVPGVCSPLAAAAVQGSPLTLQQQRLVVLPALYQLVELEATLDWADVVVLMKVSSVYGQVWQILADRGLLNQSYVVERCGWPDQKIYTPLQDWGDLQLSYFSILIIEVNPVDPPIYPPGKRAVG
jgi:precorrin-2/cobalt-factor-2 C20-methyltransferase